MDILRRIGTLLGPAIQIPAIGLDISDRSIKYVKIRSRGETLEIESFGELEVPEGAIANGEIKDGGAVSKILASWFSREKRILNTKFAAASLPEEKSFVRLVQLPKIAPQEIDNALRWEIEGNIPLPLEEMLYDYEVIEPLEDHLDHLDIVVTAFPKTIINAYLELLAGAGLRPFALELESHAFVRACALGRERSSVLLIDIGRIRTNLTMHTAGSVVFTSTLPFGGYLLEDVLGHTLGLTALQARVIKIEAGLRKKEQEGKIFAALAPSIAALADEIRRAIDYYQNHMSHTHGASRTINRIILAGGDANLDGLDTYLASALRIPVGRADPFAAFRSEMPHAVPPLTRRESLAFTQAIGLALKPYQHTSLAR